MPRFVPRLRRVRKLPAVILRWVCSGCERSNGDGASNCEGCGASW